jgi:hypothetical protein
MLRAAQRRREQVVSTKGELRLSLPSKRKRQGGKESLEPMRRFSARRLTRKESVVKREVDTYHVSDVDDTAVLYVGSKIMSICQALDLPDTDCDGLTFKQRVIQTERGDCLLLARWKPDRQMRRTAPGWSQRWFVAKKLYPPTPEGLFARLEKTVAEAEAEAEAKAAAETE